MSDAPPSRLRIAYVMINCNRRDGSARALNEVAERMARRHEVHLFARKAEDIDLANIHWHRVPGLPWPEVADFATFYWNCSHQLRAHRFDIVHSIGCNTAGANVFTIQNIQAEKRLLMGRIATTERVSLPRRLTRRLYLATTCRAERGLYSARPGHRPPLFLPVSRGVAREISRHYEIGAAPVEVIPNAADPSIFHPLSPEKRAQWRRENGLAPRDIVAIFSGGEWRRKGLDLAIETLAMVPRPELKLFVAGDDPARAQFRALVERLGLGARVIFGGFRPDIATAMGSADLFLFPSHYEAFSLAMLEAAACGLPVLAPPINGTEELLLPGVTGEWIKHEPSDIAAKLETLAADPDRRAAMGRAGRARVEEHFTWDRVAAQTEAAYRRYLTP